MATRQECFEAIDTERAYQNQIWCRNEDENAAGHNPHTITEWLAYIQHYTTEGLQKQTVSHSEGAGLPWLRKIAALAVVGMEQHGAPKREGF